jgi:hypothetical protein
MEELKAKHVLIVFLVAVLTGLILGVSAWVLASLLDIERPWLYGAGVFVVATSSTWLLLIVPKTQPVSVSKKVYPIETPEPSPLKVSIDWNDGRSGVFARMGITRDQFISWCIGVDRGRSLGENHWTGRGAVFSKGEYHQMRDELEDRGILRLKHRHHSGGYELTQKGRAVCAEVARQFGENGSTPPNTRYLPGEPIGRTFMRVRESAREEDILNS